MGFLRGLWTAWKRLGRALGDFVARVVLSVFYLTVFLPFGLGVRWSGDILKTKTMTAGWMDRGMAGASLSDARRLY